jgi:Sec-independent protein secretion pathway component TatC
MWLLFEAGLIFSRILNRKSADNDPASQGDGTSV